MVIIIIKEKIFIRIGDDLVWFLMFFEFDLFLYNI